LAFVVGLLPHRAFEHLWISEFRLQPPGAALDRIITELAATNQLPIQLGGAFSSRKKNCVKYLFNPNF